MMGLSEPGNRVGERLRHMVLKGGELEGEIKTSGERKLGAELWKKGDLRITQGAFV